MRNAHAEDEIGTLELSGAGTYPHTVMERIGVIGSGRMGTAIGSAFARAGAEVLFGTRRAGATETRHGSHRDAVAFGDVIVVAVRWSEAQRILADIGDFGGKILLSCTNAETDEAPLAVGFTTSAAELIQSWAPTARVVEAFIDTYAAHLDASPHFSVTPPTVLYCGDDDEARAVAARLIRSLGFDALDAGPLANARYMEPLAQLVVYFVRKRGLGPLGLSVHWKRH